MLKALWKYYGHWAAQLCKSWLLTKLKIPTVRHPGFSSAACFPVSLKCILKTSTEQRTARRGCLELVVLSPSFPFFPMHGRNGQQLAACARGCQKTATLLMSKDGKESYVSWELLVVCKPYRTLCMDGESSEAPCELLAHQKYLLREESRPRAFFSFSLVGLQANEEVKSSCIFFSGIQARLVEDWA